MRSIALILFSYILYLQLNRFRIKRCGRDWLNDHTATLRNKKVLTNQDDRDVIKERCNGRKHFSSLLEDFFIFMDYILPKYRFYKDLKNAQEDYRLKDKIIICDWNVNDFFKGLYFEESNIQIKKESEIKKEIDSLKEEICWVSMGTALTGTRPFYPENKETLRKVEHVLIVVGNYLNGMYDGIHLYKINIDSTYKLLTKYKN